MIVEVLVRWTDMQLKNMDAKEIELKRIIDGEEMSASAEFSYSFGPMCFNMDDVVRFNRSNDDGYTTIRFKDGDGYVVQVDYDAFKQLYAECTGKVINVVVNEEKKKREPKARKPKKEDNIDDITL
jgi:hypothetical protein